MCRIDGERSFHRRDTSVPTATARPKAPLQSTIGETLAKRPSPVYINRCRCEHVVGWHASCHSYGGCAGKSLDISKRHPTALLGYRGIPPLEGSLATLTQIAVP